MPTVSIRLVLPVILLSVMHVAPAQGQWPPGSPPPSPLMYLRFVGPAGTKITIYRGLDAHTLELPSTIGFRPGYAYRLAVWDVPGLPGQVIFPSLEVVGTLALVPRLRNADFPATIRFTEDECRKALGGSFIRKAVILERAEDALPVATNKDAPLEINVPAARDPIRDGNERGQLMAVVQMGQRFLTPQELGAYAVPGTLLLPGQRVVGAPMRSPWLLWNWCPVYDPVAGPRHPSEYVTLYDGGDTGRPAGITRGGELKGLDPSDTIASYQDSKGNQRVTASNRIGLCVPRFLVFAGESLPATQQANLRLGKAVATQTPIDIDGQVAAQQKVQEERAGAVNARQRPSGAYNSMGTSVVGTMQGLEVKTTLHTTDSVQSKLGPRKSEPADGPLRIIKWPDKCGAQVGDVVTFFLKYTNTGGQPITNVVVSDSLTPRLEYVKGSAQADRDANFTMQANGVGSEILRWEIIGELRPHESGVISFQVRIR